MRFSLKTGAVVTSAALVAVTAGLSTAAERKTAVAPAFPRNSSWRRRTELDHERRDVYNQRYSPLTQINRDNVAD